MTRSQSGLPEAPPSSSTSAASGWPPIPRSTRPAPTSAARALTKTAHPALDPGEIGSVDAVLLSHDQHVDNLDASGRAFLRTTPLVLTTASAAARLGEPSRALTPFAHIDIPGPTGKTVRITAVPAQHGPDGTEHLTGEVTGFVLTGDRVPTIYISGDNASLDVVRAIADKLGRVEIAILFAGAASTPTVPGAYMTLTSSQAAQAAQILGAAWVLPVHYNSWQHLAEGARELEDAFTQVGLADKLTLLEPGQALTLRQPLCGFLGPYHASLR